MSVAKSRKITKGNIPISGDNQPTPSTDQDQNTPKDIDNHLQEKP